MEKKEMKMSAKKIEYIYEKIAPNECLLLYKKGKEITYVVNEGGEIKIKTAILEEQKP